MRKYITKNTILLVTLLTPTIALAGDCGSSDANCKLKQSQLQAMQDAGIKPSSTVKMPPMAGIDDKKDTSKQPTAGKPEPFEIPLPPSYDSPKENTYLPNKKTATAKFTPQPQTRSKPISNAVTNQEESDEDAVDQEPTTPTTKQPTGIQYR